MKPYPFNMQSIDPPLVSVVMVIRSVDRFLAEAIESVLNQTFRDFEFIILDYGSTDSSKEIVLKYAGKDARVKLHEIPPCTYIEAKMAACALAQGRYIAVQDADDNSLPNRLLWEVEMLERTPALGVLGGSADWINADGKFLWVFRPPSSDEEIRAALSSSSPFVHSSVLMRREAFTRVGGYRRVFPHAEDYDLFLRISEHFECGNLPSVVVQYRIHPHQLSLRTRRQQTIAKLAAQAVSSVRKRHGTDPLDSIQEITPELLLQLGVSQARLQEELFFEYGNWIRNMTAAGEYSAALQAAKEVLESDWKGIDREKLADLRLTVARLYWKRRKVVRSFLNVGRAILTDPVIAGDLFATLLRRVGLA